MLICIVIENIINNDSSLIAVPCTGELHGHTVSRKDKFGMTAFLTMLARYYERMPRPKNPIQRPGEHN